MTHTIVNPADETVVTTVAAASIEDTDAAIARAARAQREWAAVAPADRARVLRRVRRGRRRRRRGARPLEVRNSGHPIGQARWEAGHVRDVLEYYSAAPERLFGRQIPVAGGLDVTFQEPLGVVGRHHAVELPDDDRVVGLRARARGGQRRGAEARRVDAAHERCASRSSASRRACPRGSSR